MAESTPLLSMQGVSKSFGGILAVHGMTFDVFAGESVGLVGPNGAGKTTLFNCVCGQLRPEHGDIIFDGQPLIGLPTYKRARLGSAAPTRRWRSSPTCRCATTSWWPSAPGEAKLGSGGICAT